MNTVIAVFFSISVFNPPKLRHLSENIFKILFISIKVKKTSYILSYKHSAFKGTEVYCAVARSSLTL